MLKKVKYGKLLGDIAEFKSYFIANNDNLVEEEKVNIKNYKQQSVRKKCKICSNILENEVLLRKGIKYFLCSTCGHFNGGFEDTEERTKSQFETSNTSLANEHARDSIQEYTKRADKIYVPKAKFLIDSLIDLDVDYKKKIFLDIGSGSGHFVSALLNNFSINNCKGIDVSKTQIAYGNSIISENRLQLVSSEKTCNYLKETNANIISAIMVLEHVNNPAKIFSALSKNENIEYFFLAVPLYSLSTFLQLTFTKVHERILGEGHTHLYTEKSLEYLFQKYNFEIVSQWWFGMDMLDLYRSMKVMLIKNGASETTLGEYDKLMKNVLDDMQLAIDKKHLSSEVHILIRKKRDLF